MSVENKEMGLNNLPDIKKLLENKDIEWALSWFSIKSTEIVNNRKEELKWNLELASFIQWLNEKETNWIDEILSNFLIQNNLAV